VIVVGCSQGVPHTSYHKPPPITSGRKSCENAVSTVRPVACLDIALMRDQAEGRFLIPTRRYSLDAMRTCSDHCCSRCCRKEVQRLLLILAVVIIMIASPWPTSRLRSLQRSPSHNYYWVVTHPSSHGLRIITSARSVVRCNKRAMIPGHRFALSPRPLRDRKHCEALSCIYGAIGP